MDGDGAGGETSGRAHRHAPSTPQHGVECQPEHEQDGAAEEISFHEETDHRDRVDCRDGQRDLDDPGPGLGAIEVERQVHRASITPKADPSLRSGGPFAALRAGSSLRWSSILKEEAGPSRLSALRMTSGSLLRKRKRGG